MELKQYIIILKETLEKKASILQALLEATERQSQIADAGEFSLDDFMESMNQKDALLEQMDELDEGFESVFGQIRVKLMENKEQYRAEITKLQALIRRCTDIGVELQIKEERNRKRLESVFALQQKELRQVRTNSRTVSNYYKSMSGRQDMESYFMDQKK